MFFIVWVKQRLIFRQYQQIAFSHCAIIKAMNYHRVSRILSYIIILIGILVIVGWVLNISWLRSVNPSWVPTKFATAVCFVMAGMVMRCIDGVIHDNSEIAPIFLSMSTLVIIILMSTYLASKFFQIPVGIEELFISTVVKGEITSEVLQPSTASMLNFIIISIAGIVVLFKPKWFQALLTAVGSFVGLIGFGAIAGYLLNIPALTFSLGAISAPMDRLSAFTFILAGLGIFLLGARHIKNPVILKNENQI